MKYVSCKTGISSGEGDGGCISDDLRMTLSFAAEKEILRAEKKRPPLF